jgi:predicted nucleic acid-binding protein
MGIIPLPRNGLVYLDASPVIYSVEKISPYADLLEPLWRAAQAEQLQLISSELLLLETLVKPIQLGDSILESTFRRFLNAPEMNLVPISIVVIEAATRLRATIRIKTPDAIHAVTARLNNCDLFVTNDAVFHRVPELPVVVLEEVLAA